MSPLSGAVFFAGALMFRTGDAACTNFAANMHGGCALFLLGECNSVTDEGSLSHRRDVVPSTSRFLLGHHYIRLEHERTMDLFRRIVLHDGRFSASDAARFHRQDRLDESQHREEGRRRKERVLRPDWGAVLFRQSYQGTAKHRGSEIVTALEAM